MSKLIACLIHLVCIHRIIMRLCFSKEVTRFTLLFICLYLCYKIRESNPLKVSEAGHYFSAGRSGANSNGTHVSSKKLLGLTRLDGDETTVSTEITTESETIPRDEESNHGLPGIRLNTWIQPNVSNFYQMQKFPVTNMGYFVVMEPQNLCSADLQYVIISLSPSHAAISRNVIRTTWGSVSRTGKWPGLAKPLPLVRVVFTLGMNLSEMANLYEEQKIYNDLLVFSFMDTYRNLTLKSLLTLKWLALNCPTVKVITKVDDDIFVNVPQLLLNLRDYTNRSNVILGNFNEMSKVLRNDGKWDIPESVFPFTYFPPYMSGPIYAMTGDVPSKLIKQAEYVFPVHLEDVYITGILPKLLKVDLHITNSFYYRQTINATACNLILYERVAIELEDREKLILWKDFEALGQDTPMLCQAYLTELNRVQWDG